MSEAIMLRVDPKRINFLNQIMEGYEYLGVVTTLSRGTGMVVIRVTPDTEGEVREILANLPLEFEYCKN
jgi:putative protease